MRKNILERTWRPVDTECNLVLLLELPRRRDNAVRREQDSAHGLLTHESHLQRLPAEGDFSWRIVSWHCMRYSPVSVTKYPSGPCWGRMRSTEVTCSRIGAVSSMTFRHVIAAFRRKLEVSLVKHPLEAACGRASLELSVIVDVRSIDAVDILDLQVRPEALFLHVDGAEPRDW